MRCLSSSHLDGMQPVQLEGRNSVTCKGLRKLGGWFRIPYTWRFVSCLRSSFVFHFVAYILYIFLCEGYWMPRSRVRVWIWVDRYLGLPFHWSQSSRFYLMEFCKVVLCAARMLSLKRLQWDHWTIHLQLPKTRWAVDGSSWITGCLQHVFR